MNSFILYTTPIWEYMSGFNPFKSDGISLLFTFILLFAIIYAGNRGDKGAIEKTVMQILIAILGAGLIYIFSGSNLLAGVGMIIVYLLDLKLRLGVSTKLFYIISAKLWGGFLIFSYLDTPLRMYSLLFIILTIFLQKDAKIQKEKKKK